MRWIWSFLTVLFSWTALAQATDSLPEYERTIKVSDPFYREDQFYIGITHSMLMQKPKGLEQRSISLGTSFGFLRDIPVNRQRTVAIAPGAGLAFYNLRHNLVLLHDDGIPAFFIENDPSKNVQKLTYLEIPIEFRWRTSKMHSHKFWRVYTGIKYSYLLNSRIKYEGSYGKIETKKNELLNQSNLGIYVTAGFNTWNFYAYYGFKPLYRKGTVDAGENYFNMVNVGLMFYIL